MMISSNQYQRQQQQIIKPPDLPINYIYTKYYCEENIYLLCQEFLRRPDVNDLWEVWVLFISNESKTVALWEQKGAREKGMAVVWDYHVILILNQKEDGRNVEDIKYPIRSSDENCEGTKEENQDKDESRKSNSDLYIRWKKNGWVYDFDTAITHVPCTWNEYTRRTFPCELPSQFESMFRVVSGEEFLNFFASDRSHMLEEGSLDTYISSVPGYENIFGKGAREQGIVNNLMSSFVGMEGGYGRVVKRRDICDVTIM